MGQGRSHFYSSRMGFSVTAWPNMTSACTKEKVLWKTVIWNVTFSELFQARFTFKGRAREQEKVKNNWLLLHFLPQNSICVRCQGSGESSLHHPPLGKVRLCYGYTKAMCKHYRRDKLLGYKEEAGKSRTGSQKKSLQLFLPPQSKPANVSWS